MKLYKVLNDDGSCYNGGVGKWNLPTQNEDGSWVPGNWMPEIEGELVQCKNGYHVCTIEQLLDWFGPAIFEVEIRGDRLSANNKIVARQARLLRKTGWNERAARLFACDCAEHALHLFEKAYPDNKQPRIAIETSRRFANGTATKNELVAARVAARVAAWAAWVAAWDAAWVAAWDARDAARDSERQWQIEQLRKILEDNDGQSTLNLTRRD